MSEKSGFDPLTLPENNATLLPEPFRAEIQKRWNRRLGDHLKLTNFGVNLTRIAPGGKSAPRHAHSRQDEFVYVLEGKVELETNAGSRRCTPAGALVFRRGLETRIGLSTDRPRT